MSEPCSAVVGSTPSTATLNWFFFFLFLRFFFFLPLRACFFLSMWPFRRFFFFCGSVMLGTSS